MSFLYPLGLLGLIGIPILIIIYIIKNKYTEQTVSSTYLWTLSEKFLKRRNPISKLAGIISLILQILTVTVVSFLIAHPIITLPDSAQEYCFILDGSGSMNIESGESTRFDAAKDKISEMIDTSVDGSVYTLIYVGDTTEVVYEQTDSKEQAQILLDELEVAYDELDYSDAIGISQEYFNENPGIQIYLLTDSSYKAHDNVEVINVSQSAENYAIGDVAYTHIGETLTVTGNLISYQSAATLKVNMYIDDSEEPYAASSISVEKGEKTPFAIETQVKSYGKIRLEIENDDALALDNEYIIHDIERGSTSYKTLIVSDRPFFIEQAIKSVLNAQIDVISPDEYKGQTGYGLYVFDSVDSVKMNEYYPADGSVWLININGSVNNSGFNVQGEEALESGEVLTRLTSSSSTAKELTADILGSDVYVTKYIKCEYYREFITLYSFGGKLGNPLIFAGSNSHGAREVVFAFDLHNSNLPLLPDYNALIRNLVKYSFPEMIDKTNFTCGEEAEVNILPNCDSVKVTSPLGNVSYLDTYSAKSSFKLTEVGTYEISMTVAGSERGFKIYSAMTESEREPVTEKDSFSILGEPGHGGYDGKYDPTVLLFIVLAIIFVMDWMVYCYEKYQLR